MFASRSCIRSKIELSRREEKGGEFDRAHCLLCLAAHCDAKQGCVCPWEEERKREKEKGEGMEKGR